MENFKYINSNNDRYFKEMQFEGSPFNEIDQFIINYDQTKKNQDNYSNGETDSLSLPTVDSKELLFIDNQEEIIYNLNDDNSINYLNSEEIEFNFDNNLEMNKDEHYKLEKNDPYKFKKKVNLTIETNFEFKKDSSIERQEIIEERIEKILNTIKNIEEITEEENLKIESSNKLRFPFKNDKEFGKYDNYNNSDCESEQTNLNSLKMSKLIKSTNYTASNFRIRNLENEINDLRKKELQLKKEALEIQLKIVENELKQLNS